MDDLKDIVDMAGDAAPISSTISLSNPEARRETLTIFGMVRGARSRCRSNEWRIKARTQLINMARPTLLALLILLPTTLTTASDPGADKGQTPGLPIVLDRHFSSPSSGLNTMGVYSTNFAETPYCCPFSPKQFEVEPPSVTNGTNNGGWGVVPIICQLADAGQNGVFNAAGTVLLGDSWVLSNRSVAFYGHAGSRNGPYYFGFAMDPDRKNLHGFFTFQDQLNGANDGGVITGPWDWTYVREPTVAECKFALRETRSTESKLYAN